MREFPKARVVAVLAAATLACLAHAQSLTFDDQKAMIDAQLQLARKQQELNTALALLASPAQSAMPAVVAILGMNGKLQARLQLSTGAVMNYSEGETIRPGMQVAAITPRMVTVAVGEGKKRRVVPIEFLAGASNAAGGMQAGVRVPAELLPDPPPIPMPAAARTPAPGSRLQSPIPAAAPVPLAKAPAAK